MTLKTKGLPLDPAAADDLVCEWERLIQEWDSAMISYEEARKTLISEGLEDPELFAHNFAVQAALSRLEELKREIDLLVQRAGARRVRKDHFILGIIQSKKVADDE
jgi:hypothetical protein